MGLSETWNEMDSGVKVLVGLGVVLAGGFFLLLAIPVLVVLAAVVGSFALGLGDAEAAAPEAPQVSMNFEYDEADEAVTITHEGGDNLEQARVRVQVGDQRLGWDESGGTITPGDETTVGVERGQTVEVVWLGEQRQILGSYEVPR